ncbi:MAG: hypothetical protein AB7Q16_23905 [Vicinamibacterales bacterium]
MWTAALLAVGILATACSQPAPPPAAPAQSVAPQDPQHAGITEPHGDHTPQHGGLVLMNGDIHYEVVLNPSGRHAVWFTDAIRTELPAAVASNVRLVVTRPDAPPEALALEIDESGESWIARGQPVAGDAVMVKLTYDIRGVPHEVEIPFIPPKP